MSYAQKMKLVAQAAQWVDEARADIAAGKRVAELNTAKCRESESKAGA